VIKYITGDNKMSLAKCPLLIFINIMPLVRLPLDTMSKTDSLTYIENSDRLLYARSSFPQANIKMIMPSNL
jgi:hypothetical protein